MPPPFSAAKEDRISDTLTLIHPLIPEAGDNASTSCGPRPPKLILMATWMAAQRAHIKKYVNGQQRLFPGTAILLMECPLRYMVLASLGRAAVQPAVPIVQKYCPHAQTIDDSSGWRDKHETREPELFLHIFSNGGSAMTAFLLESVRQANIAVQGGDLEQDKTASLLLPRYAIVFDSAPGRFSCAGSYAAMSMSLPQNAVVRMLAWPILHALIGWYVMQYFVFGCGWSSLCSVFSFPSSKSSSIIQEEQNFLSATTCDDPLARFAFSHNATPLRRNAEVGGRSYIYGVRDVMVDWRDVEFHAADAVAKKFADVRLECFGKSAHVAHTREDEERYWRIVAQRWGWWWLGSA